MAAAILSSHEQRMRIPPWHFSILMVQCGTIIVPIPGVVPAIGVAMPVGAAMLMPVAIEVIVAVAMILDLHLGASRRSPTRRLPIRGKLDVLPDTIQAAALPDNDDRSSVFFTPARELAFAGRVCMRAKCRLN
jgi:hypothetical protein